VEFNENVLCWCSSVIEGLEFGTGLGSGIGLAKDIIDNRNELWTQAGSFMQDCDEWALCFIPTAGTLGEYLKSIYKNYKEVIYKKICESYIKVTFKRICQSYIKVTFKKIYRIKIYKE
jgi:hypothetical protein